MTTRDQALDNWKHHVATSALCDPAAMNLRIARFGEIPASPRAFIDTWVPGHQRVSGGQIRPTGANGGAAGGNEMVRSPVADIRFRRLRLKRTGRCHRFAAVAAIYGILPK